MPQLALRRLTKDFGRLRVVDGIDLELERGEFLSLLGPSGCGKTTTLRMIAGFIEPSEGSIEVDGKVLSGPGFAVPPERRGMSMIFQSYAIWPNRTVAENVAFGLKLRKLPRSEVDERVNEMLDTVHLRELSDRYPAELSGGQQQRVALARAIVVKPSVLLLDEPLSNLDANLREEMRSEIRKLHDAFRITTIYVTHDQAEAMAVSDRIAVMNQGRVEQVDTPHRLYARPKTRFVAGFVGRTNLLDGRWEDGVIAFDGFRIDGRILVGGDRPPASGTVVVSVRPQALTLRRVAASTGTGPGFPGTIASRTYLGESWEYVVALSGSSLMLRVATPALELFEQGAAVWVGLDPAQAVIVG